MIRGFGRDRAGYLRRRPGSPAAGRRGFGRILADFAGSSPPRTALLIFALTIAVFTALLSMPWATAGAGTPQFHDAFFVATSAVSVTGLTPVNTAEHWSLGGQIVILVGIQIGGLGILSVASLLAVSVTRGLGLRTRLIAQEGMTTGRLGEVGSLLRTVVVCSLVVEAVLASILIPRMIAIEGNVVDGLWHGLFYAVSAFNNAGFVIHPDGLADLGYDPVVLWVIMAGVFLGSLGFPVLLMLYRRRTRISQWGLHTRITVEVTLAMLLLGTLLYGLMEWNNAETLGALSTGNKLQDSLFASVMMRSGGFSVVDTAAETPETMLVTNALMFVGGGSVSTAGGIKVTTFAVILLAVVAEARGHQDLILHGRRIASSTLRVAIAVVALAATLILISTLALTTIAGEDVERPLFESISAFATCGLSSGLTAELPPSGLFVLGALMFAGRVGIITFATALALRQRTQRLRLPESRPVIG